MATVDDFKAKLIGGGARANLFKATIAFPAYAAGDTELTQFMCKAAQLPASVVGQIDVTMRNHDVLTSRLWTAGLSAPGRLRAGRSAG